MFDLTNLYPPGINENLHESFSGIVRSIFMKSCFNFKIKRTLGIAGFNSNFSSPECWTVKLRGKEGVYGVNIVYIHETDDEYECYLGIKYFPMNNEEALDNFSIAEIMAANDPSYTDSVRNFTSVDAFFELFGIGEVSLHFPKKENRFTAELYTETFTRTVIREGLYLKGETGELQELVPPMGYDRNIPSYRLALPFFKAFTGALAYSMETSADKISKRSSGAFQTILSREGAEEVPSRTAHMLFLALTYEGKDGESSVFKTAVRKGWWNEEIKSENKIMDSRPRLLIISGFLGSGKTTFIKKLIEYETEKNRFVGIIQNEAGETGLDGFLLDYDCSLVQIDEGCVCCTLSGQLKMAIADLSKERIPDTIILETSGVANPMNLLSEIEDIKDIVAFDSVTTVVDTPSAEERINDSDLVCSQIMAADIVVMNKTDMTDEEQVQSVYNMLKRLNPNALYAKAVNGYTAFPLLYGEERESRLTDTGAMHNHTHEHITTRKISLNKPLSRDELLSLIKNEAENAFRVKGLADIDTAENTVVIQGVNGRIELQKPDREPPKERFIVIIENSESHTSCAVPHH